MTDLNLLTPELRALMEKKKADEEVIVGAEPEVVEEAKVEEKVEEQESPELIAYKDMLIAANDSLEGKVISDLSLGHPYWGLMNRARQYKHEKGLL